MSQTWSGIIMAADNVLALFMLPLFGAISDKCSHKKGRRTPFIVMGTLIAAVALICLSFIDNAQLKHLATPHGSTIPPPCPPSMKVRRTSS